MEKDYPNRPNQIDVSIGQYESCIKDPLDENGNLRLLTADEEIWLATTIQTGQQALACIGISDASLDPQTEQNLLQQIKESETALRTLVLHNMRLVGKIVKRYSHYPQEDLLQSGFIGLIQAAYGYDPFENGTRFTTYAYRAITNEMRAQRKEDRYPLHVNDATLENLLTIVAFIGNFQSKNDGKSPGVAELAEHFNIKEAIARRYLIRTRIIQTPLELDAHPLNTDFETENRIGILPDPRLSVEDQVLSAMRNAEIRELLEASGLKESHWEIMKMFFGLDGQEPLTQGQIGEKKGISKARVGQILRKSIKKIKEQASQRDIYSLEDI